MPTLNPLRFYLINFPGETVFTGRVNGNPSDPYIEIDYDAGVTGSFGNPIEGQSVWFGSTSGGKERGVLRLRNFPGGASGTIKVAESDDVGPQIQNNDYITIKNEFRLWPKYPRFQQSGTKITIFEDYDVAYTNQTSQWRPKAVAGPPGFAMLEGGQAQISFFGQESVRIAQGSSLSSFLWTARGSVEGTSTTQGTKNVPVVFTWTSPGRYLVTFQVTDSNGQTDTQHTWAIIESPDNLQVSFTDFDITSDNFSFDQGGGELSFNVPETDGGVSDFPEESMIMLVAVGDITTPDASWKFRENVLFNGWIQTGSVRQNPDTKDISFRASSLDSVMKNLTIFPVSLSDVNSAVKWTQAENLTATRALHYLYLYRSTVGLIASVIYPDFTEKLRRQDFGQKNLYGMVQNELMRSIHGAGRLLVTKQGVVYHEIDYNVLRTSERSSIDTGKLLHKGVWVGSVSIEEREDYAQPTNKVSMSGIHYPGGQVDDICPIFSEAPGDAPKVYGGESSFDRLIVISSADLNARSGLMLAKLNARYPTYRMNFLNDGSFSNRQIVFPANIEAADNNREIVYSGNLIPRRITRTYDHANGFFSDQVEFEPETTGPPGVTVDLPCGPPDQEKPDEPDPPVSLPQMSALIAGTTGTSFYFQPGLQQTWQRRVSGLLENQIGFLDILPDPWSTFKQGYNPNNTIIWGSGKGSFVRSTDSGQAWSSRAEFLGLPAWSGEVGTVLADLEFPRIQMDIFSEDRLYLLARWQYTGTYHGAVAKTTDGFAYDWFNLTGSSAVRPLGMSLDRGNGLKLYITTWENEPTGTLYLNQYDTASMTLAGRFNLGEATSSEIDARTYYATPFNRNAQASELFIYGAMDQPQGFTGNVQVLRNTNCGATGSYSVIENTWESDHAGSFGADSKDQYYAVRNGGAGGIPSIGSEQDTGADKANNTTPAVCKASSTKGIILYEDTGNVDAMAFSIDGGSISTGTPLSLTAIVGSGIFSCAYLEDDKIFAVYSDGTDLLAKVVTLSGLSLSAGAEVTIIAGNTTGFVAELNSAEVIVIYGDDFKHCDISGTTITVNGAQTWTANVAVLSDVVTIGNGTKVVVYYDRSGDRYMTTKLIYSITDSAHSTSSEAVVDDSSHSGQVQFGAAFLSETAIVATYPRSNDLYMRQVTESGNALTAQATEIKNTTNIEEGDGRAAPIIIGSGGWCGYGDSNAFFDDFSISGNSLTFQNTDTNWDADDRQYYRGVRCSDTLGFIAAHPVGAGNVKLFIVTGGGGSAKFYQGSLSLSEKFTLPFSQVEPQAMTLDRPLGTVVFGSNAATAQPIVFTQRPYNTGFENTSLGYPTGTSTFALKWI